MSVHLGNRAKYLVEKNYHKTKKELAEALGFKQEKYVFEIFRKEDLSTELLKKLAVILGVSLIDFVIEETGNSLVQEPTVSYGKKESEIVKALKSTIKSQEITIRTQELTINLLQKELEPKIKLEKKTQEKEKSSK